MTHVVPTADLRAATEANVIEAIEHSDLSDALHGIAPLVLLRFFQSMVDQIAGKGE